MFVMVFVEHILWGGNCIQRQKNTGMIGVSFSKSVSKVRINVWDGSCKTHFLKCVLYSLFYNESTGISCIIELNQFLTDSNWQDL